MDSTGAWERPSRCCAGDDAGRPPLTAAQVEQWRTAGFVAVKGLWPQSLIDRLSADNHRAFPEGGSLPGEQSIGDGMEFPAHSSSAVNEVALHDRYTSAAAELLGVESSQLRLGRAGPQLGEDGARRRGAGRTRRARQ